MNLKTKVETGPHPSRAQSLGAWVCAGLVCLGVCCSGEVRAADPMPGLLRALAASEDTQFQLDVLRGLEAALRSHRTASMPEGWGAVEAKLAGSGDPQVVNLTRSIALKFGSESARVSLRQTLLNHAENPTARQAALDALLGVRDPALAGPLQELLSDPPLRSAALKALAAYDDPGTPTAILGVYAQLGAGERRDALNTLGSRPQYARPLLAAVERGAVSVKDLSADLVRQLRGLKDAETTALLTKVYGVMRETTADKQQEIERYRQIYRAGGSTPGDAARGRVVFNKACAQCHLLFGEGGKVGPDITGSQRGDLDYILQNIVDPNAVIPNEYISTSVETRDGRSLIGVVNRQDETSLSLLTVAGVVTLQKSEILTQTRSEQSMMPEGLLAGLTDQEVRDLIYYLGRPGQVDLPAGAGE